MPKLLGVTGGFGAGKSTVGEVLRSHGVVVIDSDEVVHKLLREDRRVKDSVAKRFGDSVQLPDGSIDRKTLAGIVFGDPAARKDLERIVHPAVRETVDKKVSEQADDVVVALLVPLLFEANMANMFVEVWSVDAPYEICVARLKERNGLTKEEIDLRMQAQMPQKEKNARAHAVIDNSGTIEQTSAQVVKLLAQLH